MKLYLLYIVTSFSVMLFILWLYATSEGFSSYSPLLSLLGSILLLVVATPLLFDNLRRSLVLGFCSGLLMIQYFVIYSEQLPWPLSMFNLLLTVALFSTFVVFLDRTTRLSNLPTNRFVKLGMSTAPALIFGLFFY